MKLNKYTMKNYILLIIASLFISCTNDNLDIDYEVPVSTEKTGLRFFTSQDLDRVTFRASRQGKVLGEFGQAIDNLNKVVELQAGTYVLGSFNFYNEGEKVVVETAVIGEKQYILSGRSVVVTVKENEVVLISL